MIVVIWSSSLVFWHQLWYRKLQTNNKLASPIYISLLVPCGVTQRSLRFMFVRLNAELYVPNQRQFGIDFKDKININFWGQIPIQFKKGLKGCFEIHIKETSFWNFDHATMTRVERKLQKWIIFYKKTTFTTSHFQGFFKGSVKTSNNGTQVTTYAYIGSN